MSDDPSTGAQPSGHERKVAALKAHQWGPGQSGNKTGSNRYVKAQARLRKFAMENDPDTGIRRDDEVLKVLYRSACIPGPQGAADRKLWNEQLRGKAKVQMEVNASVTGLRVLAMLPDNGHGPDDNPEPDGGDAGSSAG